MASLTISCRPVSFAQRITLANEPADGAQLPSRRPADSKQPMIAPPYG